MRVKVTAAAATTIVSGPATVHLQNKTAPAAVFLEIVPEGGKATEASGYEWGASAGVLGLVLHSEQTLSGIVKAAGAEQELHVLHS